MSAKISKEELKKIEEVSKKIRREILIMIYNAKSGHPGGSLSSVDILNVLFTKCMKHYPECEKNKDYKNRDRFVLSKGHASPALYAVMAHCGYFSEDELLTFRKFGTRLQGHPSMRHLPGIEVSTGSLGQGLSIACGMALGMRLDGIKSKVFAYIGDGELQEGNIWEAVMNAAARKLNNIVAIIDRNRLQIDGSTEDIKNLGDVKSKFKAFGWDGVEIDGHNLNEIYDAIEQSKLSDKPFVIVANTIKGKGVSFMENNASWHGKAPKEDELKIALAELN